MRGNIEIPWERYALISEIVRRFDESHRRLGKTVLQKLIFLLQRVHGVDCGYSYTLYTYGPYCADVARDLDVIESFGGAVIHNAAAGYAIHSGPVNAELRASGADFLTEISEALDHVLADFAGFNAKELELRSTIVYLCRPGASRAALIHEFQQVKPYFAEQQIAAAIDELVGLGLLGGCAAGAA